MAKADSKVQSSASCNTSKTMRRKPANGPSQTCGESIKRTQSSKKPSPVQQDAIQSAPNHAKRVLDTTSEISRPAAKRTRLAKTSTIQANPEHEEGKSQAITQRLLPEPRSASAVPRAQTPQLTLKSNSRGSELQPKRAQLTRHNLARFDKTARVGGSEEPESASLLAETETELTGASTNWPAFARNSRMNVSTAMNKATLQCELVSKLLKPHGTREFTRVLDQECTAFPSNVGFNDGLRVLKPDFIEGLVVDEFDPFPVDEYIEGAVMHEAEYPVTLPHLAGEWKTTGGSLDDARIQTAYDGASLVYARNQALAYLRQEKLSNDAEVITFATNGSALALYAHYASEGEDGTVKYHQYIIGETFLNSYTDFKSGRKQLRNAQEYAKEQCYLLRDQLKEQWAKSNTSAKLVEEPPGSLPLAPSVESLSAPRDSSVPRQGREQRAPPSKGDPMVIKPSGVRRSKRKNAGLLSKKTS
ncbi:hypothetical protein O1611_g4361 [Lasiodiplodia mahajangana]|uniref:Uncharacterized protein n=1 Tax=Lasiodiplodia mahajangana TaxID=1108764 RepID=A0ACC2JP64_9PEZI|nr:hypothetical protein O1611_g4361 [Lasiodiplodia mahajangana]